MRPPIRHGIECEGPNVGLPTVIVGCEADHRVEVLREAEKELGAAKHVWLEVLDEEQFDWQEVRRILEAGYLVTVVARTDADLPPYDLRTRVSVVWMVPEGCRRVADLASHMKVRVGRQPYECWEIGLQGRRAFDPADYEGDVVWDK